jgi:hypothetical protein
MTDIHLIGMQSRREKEWKAKQRLERRNRKERKRMVKLYNTTHDECVSLRPIWTPVGHRHSGKSMCSLCGGQSPGKAISKQKGFVKEKFKAGTNVDLDHILNEKMLLDLDAWLIAFYEGEMDPHGGN